MSLSTVIERHGEQENCQTSQSHFTRLLLNCKLMCNRYTRHPVNRKQILFDAFNVVLFFGYLWISSLRYFTNYLPVSKGVGVIVVFNGYDSAEVEMKFRENFGCTRGIKVIKRSNADKHNRRFRMCILSSNVTTVESRINFSMISRILHLHTSKCADGIGLLCWWACRNVLLEIIFRKWNMKTKLCEVTVCCS